MSDFMDMYSTIVHAEELCKRLRVVQDGELHCDCPLVKFHNSGRTCGIWGLHKLTEEMESGTGVAVLWETAKGNANE